MRIIKTNMSKESTEAWREELRRRFPNYIQEIDMGVLDYLFSCIDIAHEDVFRAVTESRNG